MPFPLIPLAISGLSALAGGLGNREQTSKSRPVYTPGQTQLQDSLIRGYLGLSEEDPAYWRNYELQGLKDIDEEGAAGTNLVSNLLTSRGLSRTTGGTSALFNQGLNTLKRKADFSTMLPIIRRNQRATDLRNAGQFFNSMPTAQESTQPGNVAGGTTSGLASALAYFYGKGAFGGN